MNTDSRAWLDGLTSFVASHRRSKPPPSISAAAAAARAERTILGASLSTRLLELDSVREARRTMAGCDPDPAIVVTTSMAGFAALDELRGQRAGVGLVLDSSALPVTELEYRLWCIRRPDDAFRHHVNLWSWVKTRVPAQRRAEFAAYPLAAGADYWLHREGLSGGGELDRRASHLWRWDGRTATLLKAFIRERAAPRLGDAAH